MPKPKPPIIGLTGNIGSGKSTVARLLLAKGAALIDSDALARQASEDPVVLQAIAEALGPDLVKNGALERAKTAERVFGDAAALETLNGIIHPWVRRESARQVEALRTQPEPPALILLDIPLLYENGLETTVDAVIVVNAPLELRVERATERSGLSKEAVLARDKAQLPLETKVERADYVLDNSGTLTALEKQVDALWTSLVRE